MRGFSATRAGEVLHRAAQMTTGTRSGTGRVRLIGGKVTVAVLGALLAVAVVHLWPKSSSGSPTVVLQWENEFLLDGGALSDTEVGLVKVWAVHTLRQAYSGFAVELSERDGTNVIHVRDACTHPRCAPDTAGETWPLSKSSNVYYSVLAERALHYAKERPRDRTGVLMGLGQGIGATAAHEFAHEWPLGMPTIDQRRDQGGYDYYTFDRYQHFYGQLHWTEPSLQFLRKHLRY